MSATPTSTASSTSSWTDRLFYSGCTKGLVCVRAIFWVQAIALGCAVIYLTSQVQGPFQCMVKNPEYISIQDYADYVEHRENNRTLYSNDEQQEKLRLHEYLREGDVPKLDGGLTVKAWLYVFGVSSSLYLFVTPIILFVALRGPNPAQEPAAAAERRNRLKAPAAAGYCTFLLLVLFRVLWAFVGIRMLLANAPCDMISPTLPPYLGTVGLFLTFIECCFELTFLFYGGRIGRRQEEREAERAQKLRADELHSISTWGYDCCNLGHDLECAPDTKTKNIFVCVRCDEALNYEADAKTKMCPHPGCEEYYVCSECWTSGKQWTETAAGSAFASVNKSAAPREGDSLLFGAHRQATSPAWKSDRIKARELREQEERQHERRKASAGRTALEVAAEAGELCKSLAE